MPGEDISPEVREFIHRAINSVEQLELLLFLMSHADQAWTPDEAAERLNIRPEQAAATMDELRSAGLVAKDGSGAFRYRPGSSALAKEVAASLDLAYRERRHSLLQIIYSRPLENIRIFADAFRIKNEEEED